MTGFCDLNLKFPLILAISVFLRSLNSCSAELSMKKFYNLWVHSTHMFSSQYTW